MLFSALLSTPFCLANGYLIPEYWNPHRLLSLTVSLEDLIFSFATGGLAWLSGVLLIPSTPPGSPSIRPRPTPYLYGYLYGFALLGISLLLGLNYMWGTLVAIYSFGFLLVSSNRSWWPLGCWGAMIFGLIYCLALKGSYALWPHFLLQWNLSISKGWFFGLPLEEVAWAWGYGFTWPLFMAFVFDVRVWPPRPVHKISPRRNRFRS